MRDQGYGENYEYDHDSADGFSGQNYFPENIDRFTAYQPVERGFERELKKLVTSIICEKKESQFECLLT